MQRIKEILCFLSSFQWLSERMKGGDTENGQIHPQILHLLSTCQWPRDGPREEAEVEAGKEEVLWPASQEPNQDSISLDPNFSLAI